jgi:predicted transposase YdaD
MILGIRGIEESSVYQGIFAEGEVKGRSEGLSEGEAVGQVTGTRNLFLRFAETKLGKPNERVLSELMGMNDLAKLQNLADQLPKVSSWDELLAEPTLGRADDSQSSSS